VREHRGVRRAVFRMPKAKSTLFEARVTGFEYNLVRPLAVVALLRDTRTSRYYSVAALGTGVHSN
jgi:hypothetical protein